MGWGEGDILPFRRHEARGGHTGVFLSILLGTLFVGVLWKVHGKLPGPHGAPSVLSIISSLLLTPALHTSPRPPPAPTSQGAAPLNSCYLCVCVSVKYVVRF